MDNIAKALIEYAKKYNTFCTLTDGEAQFNEVKNLVNNEEAKELLKDLYARLPYGVKIHYESGISGDEILTSICIEGNDFIINGSWSIKNVKPYLRQMTSMTEEEMVEYATLQDRFLLSSQYPVTDAYELFDWLNAHHFDFRGLIDKGLAIEAPKGMYDL